MKQRIISSVVGLILLALVLFFFETAVLNIAIALISVMAVYELLGATGCLANKLISVFTLIFSALIPFFSLQAVRANLVFICYLYILALFICLLAFHNQLHIQEIALSFFFGLIIPFSLSTIIYFRDRWGAYIGIFYVLMILGSAWLSDTGAYFSGRAFGKHKLAPYISPKKTVEGAIGGAVFAEVMMLLIALLYRYIAGVIGHPVSINLPALLALVPFFSAISIVGDLSASIIKRQFGVKDYGSIMPGHGGVMDRFDSVLMVAPIVCIISIRLPIIQFIVK